MPLQRYKFHWPYILLTAGAYSIAFIIALFSRPFPNLTEPFVFLNVFFILFLFSDLYFGIYCTFDGRLFCQTSHFFFKKCIHVNDIESIVFPKTFDIGEVRTLCVIGTADGEAVSIRMTELAYTRKVLAKIVLELSRANPRIDLDDITTSQLNNRGQ